MESAMPTMSPNPIIREAFAQAEGLSGYTIKIWLKSGVMIEGAPDAPDASHVGPILTLMNYGPIILVSEIAAIQVDEI
jgi:hypothetical protein